MDTTPQTPQQPTQPVGPTPPPPTTPTLEPAVGQDTNRINVNISTDSNPVGPMAPNNQPVSTPSPISIAVTSVDEVVAPKEQAVSNSEPVGVSAGIPVSTPASTAQPTYPQTPPQVTQPASSVPSTQSTVQMQSPKPFDTSQYHLPIEHSKKHNAGLQMLIFGIVFVTVLVIGGLLAVDAGLIDLGFESPINLIK